MRVAYLGPAGTFSEEAAYRCFSAVDIAWHVCPTIPDVLDAVSSGTADQGVIPIENSIEGSVNAALDRLLELDNLFVCREIVLPIEQHLLGLPGTSLDQVQEVWSIPPALAQCRQFLQRHNLRQQHFPSTAAAAQAVIDSGRSDVAAVASKWAATKMGLHILSDNIQDAQANHTRFVVVTRDTTPPENASKTMLLVLPAAEHAGVLAQILNVFASFGLNLTWIVSRPAKTVLGMYQFALDVEAGLSDYRMHKSLEILRIYGHHVRVLGSYFMGCSS
jgi:prephenate dehydratase